MDDGLAALPRLGQGEEEFVKVLHPLAVVADSTPYIREGDGDLEQAFQLAVTTCELPVNGDDVSATSYHV